MPLLFLRPQPRCCCSLLQTPTTTTTTTRRPSAFHPAHARGQRSAVFSIGNNHADANTSEASCFSNRTVDDESGALRYISVRQNRSATARVAYRHHTSPAAAAATTTTLGVPRSPNTHTHMDAATQASDGHLVILVLNGFGSSMDNSNKVNSIVAHVKENWQTANHGKCKRISTLCMDYRGHGKSTTVCFSDCNNDDPSTIPTSASTISTGTTNTHQTELHQYVLGDWIHDAQQLLRQVVTPLSNNRSQTNEQRQNHTTVTTPSLIIVASSMGAWIATHIISQLASSSSSSSSSSALASSATSTSTNINVVGFIGIASGPNFIQHIYDHQLSPRQKYQELPQRGRIHFSSRYDMTSSSNVINNNASSSNNNNKNKNKNNNKNNTTAASTKPYSVILTQRLFDDAKRWQLPFVSSKAAHDPNQSFRNTNSTMTVSLPCLAVADNVDDVW